MSARFRIAVLVPCLRGVCMRFLRGLYFVQRLCGMYAALFVYNNLGPIGPKLLYEG